MALEAEDRPTRDLAEDDSSSNENSPFTERSAPAAIKKSFRYSECSLTELKHFTSQRRLDLNSEEAERRRCINELEYQHKNATFPSFLELPPEIRELIYDLIVVSSEPAVSGSSDNPIPLLKKWNAGGRLAVAETNKEERERALSRFYAGNFFSLPLDTTTLHPPMRQAYRKITIARVEQTAAQQPLKRVKHLVLNVRHTRTSHLFPHHDRIPCKRTIVVETAKSYNLDDTCSTCGNVSVVPTKVQEWRDGLIDDGEGKMTIAAIESLLDISEALVEDDGDHGYDSFGPGENWAELDLGGEQISAADEADDYFQ
ncbi:hypothetical protein LTR49_028631 [Elasticomyces elasticus]|nr:hypothetical protein LTR49_028631 [Elasticomyces elasticus]